MSLASMAEDSALRKKGTPGPSPRVAARNVAGAAVTAGANPAVAHAANAAADSASTGTSVGASALTQLTRYIPTETIALYLAVAAALGTPTPPKGGQQSSADYGPHWAWFWALSAMTALLATGLSYRSQKQLSQERFQIPIIEIAAATVAFGVWALSLPGTPLNDVVGYDAKTWGPVILLGGTIVVAATTYVFGANVSWQKVLTSEDAAQ